MLIGVDLDEVLADFASGFIKYHNESYGTSYEKEDIFSYNFWEVLKCEREEAIQRINDFFESPNYKEIQPVEGSIEAVSELKKNHELVIVTSRQEQVRNDTKKWVNNYFPNIFSEIYFSNNHYTKTGGNISKADICDKQKIDLLIEDSLPYVLSCHDKMRVFLFNQPWNRTKELPDNVKRVYGWEDVLQKI